MVSGCGDHLPSSSAKETEAAQTLLGRIGSIGLEENSGSIAFLSKDALGLRFVP